MIGMSDTETLDRLYLEWSQFTHAKTAREIELYDALSAARALIDNIGQFPADEFGAMQEGIVEKIDAALRNG